MGRLFRLALFAAFIGVLLFGASWAAAYFTVGTLLGAPPPKMGTQKTIFAYKGAPQLKNHPIAWIFSFGPTVIPGAPKATIYVSPTGRLLATDPSDLKERLQRFHATGI